jgi:peptide/nickel transport system permease protein
MSNPFQNRRRPKFRQALWRAMKKLWIGWDLALLLVGYSMIFGFAGLLFQKSGAYPLFNPDPDAIAWSPPDAQHWLGRDGGSMDMLLRTVRAGAVSLWAAGLATVAGSFAGLVLATLMALTIRDRGYRILTGLTDLVSCVPAIVLALILFAGIGGGFLNSVVIFAVLIAFFTVGRASRWFFELEFSGDVLAARGLGYSRLRLLRENFLSHLWPKTAAWVAGLLPAVLLAEAALSFAGFGLGKESPSLGRLIAEGRTVMFEAPWLIIYPGLVLWALAVVLAMLGWVARRTAQAEVAEPVF